jgi:thiamine-phosphate pyrophosphorylase
MAAPETARVNAVTRAERIALLHGIYAIVNEGRDPIAIARAATGAGIRIVQYRAKGGIVEETLHELRALTRACGALLIVNDDAAAAVRCDCDGVHLGPDDPNFSDVAPVRAALGDRLIGLSCGTVEEALAAASHDVDYLGVGSVYATGSKPDAGAPIGIDGLVCVTAATRFPVAAIGGIDAFNLGTVARTGVAMAAVISAIAGDPDPAFAAGRLVRAWDEATA